MTEPTPYDIHASVKKSFLIGALEVAEKRAQEAIEHAGEYDDATAVQHFIGVRESIAQIRRDVTDRGAPEDHGLATVGRCVVVEGGTVAKVTGGPDSGARPSILIRFAGGHNYPMLLSRVRRAATEAETAEWEASDARFNAPTEQQWECSHCGDGEALCGDRAACPYAERVNRYGVTNRDEAAMTIRPDDGGS